MSMPDDRAREQLDAADACARRRPPPAARAAAHARASCARRPARARACVRSSSRRADARRQLLERRLERGATPLRRAATCVRRVLARARVPVSASMRRTPAATALSPTTVNEADVAGAPHMGAAAQLDRAGHACCRRPRPSRRRAPRRRISRRTARARRRRRASSGAISRVVDRRVLQHDVVGDVLDPRELVGRRSAWDGRSRSAAGRARPASPSASRGRRAPGAAPRAADASPNGCARIARAARVIDVERQRASPSLSVPCSTVPRWTNRSPTFFCVSVTREAHAVAPSCAPVSPTWPPDSP